MPLYDYKCANCEKITEVRHGFNDVHREPCPACGAPLSRVFNPAPILFKGSGFYVTDSRAKTESASKPDAPKVDTPKTEAPKADAPAKPASSSKESAA